MAIDNPSDWEVVGNSSTSGDDWEIVDNKSQEKPSFGMNKETASAIYRPALEAGGAVLGGMAGLPLAPATMGAAPVAGGALGYGIGKSAADLADRYMGIKDPIKNFPEAIKETGQNAMKGAEFEAANMVAGPIVKGLFNNPVTRAAGKTIAGLGQWATNIPSRDYQTLFKNPEGFLPGSLERASAKFSEASKSAGIPEELTPEQLDNILGPKARRVVKSVYAKVFNSEPVSAAEAQNAKQMLDAIYPNPTAKNGRLLHALDTIRNSFQDVISRESPALREANKDYAIAKAGSKFKSIFPKTLTSRPEFVRTGLLGTLALKNPIAAATLTPIGQGIMVAGAGATKNLIEGIASNPKLTAPIVSKTMSMFGSKNNSVSKTDPYETKLNPSEESRFQEWKLKYAPNDSGEDYDLRGAFKAGLKPGENGHWSDQFKKPNHPTFSVESQYAKYAPEKAGSWEGDKYIPAKKPKRVQQNGHTYIFNEKTGQYE